MSKRWGRALVLVCIIGVAYVSLAILPSPSSSAGRWTHEGFWNPTSGSDIGSAQANNTPCSQFSADIWKKIQIVLKTGAAEDPDRLRLHLKHSHGRDIIDVLSYLPDDFEDLDFDYYSQQKKFIRIGSRFALDSDRGWTLDRFKFLPMIYAAYTMRPEAAWYIFIETDTFLFIDNLISVLDHFSPALPLYLGSPVHSPDEDKDLWFSYGGSGFALSNTAAEKLLYTNITNRNIDSAGVFRQHPQWLQRMRTDIYGESILASSLKDVGVSLSGMYPSFYPLNAESIKFGKNANAQWCEPIISLHKLTASTDYQKLSAWMTSRQSSVHPILFEDLFVLLRPSLDLQKPDWDNLTVRRSSNDTSHSSLASCKAACIADAVCLQYFYHDNQCHTADFVAVGNHRAPAIDRGLGLADVNYVSGWILDRIDQVLGTDHCSQPSWPQPSLEKHW